MKNVFKVLGIIAFIAIIGFSMAACSDDGGSGSGSGGSSLAGTTWTYTESGGSVTLTFIDSSKVKMGTFNGTYTLNGSSGTINWDDGDRDTFTVNGNQLTMDGYTFTKTGGGNSGGNTPSGSGSGGSFTLTGIPSQYNGKYAMASGIMVSNPGTLLIGCDRPDVSRTLISNGTVILPMWYSAPPYYTLARYSGNDSDVTVTVSISNSQPWSIGDEKLLYVLQFYAVNFSNGNGTKSWNAADIAVVPE